VTLPLAPEVTVADRYVLTERIAVGGMGEVWRARDSVLGRTVALKVLKPEYATDPAFLARFRNEARHTAALSHPGIANTFDYGELGDMAYLVMECVDGDPLSAVLAREGRLPADHTMDIVGQAALALQAAHEAGVVHRDVKPANLLIRPDGVVKVTDFGIARAVDAAPVTQTGLVVGTAAYLSPEQATGKPVTAASDIYSLGVVTYECLTGSRPFTGESPVAMAMAHINDAPPPLPKDVPPLVADFVQRAMDKDPARRQPSAGDFGRTALALATTLRDQPAATDPAVGPAAGPTPTKVMTAAPLLAPAPAAASAAAGAAAGGYDDAQRRRIRNLFIAVGAAVVLLGFFALRSCDLSSAPTAAPRSTTSASPRPTPRVQVRDVDYVGHAAAAVVTALHGLGLHVREMTLQGPGPAGTVVGVSPTGSVPRGATIILTVLTAPTPAPPAHGKHKGKDGGEGGDH
jgi:tRNA A-37 threonylcarbamoyl transferase component Bud32